jgi:hypothetical protein
VGDAARAALECLAMMIALWVLAALALIGLAAMFAWAFGAFGPDEFDIPWPRRKR